MAKNGKKKGQVSTFGYGVLALYALGMVAMAGIGVFGVNLTNLIMRHNESERTRAQVRSGKMVVVGEDREECRTYNFDNRTAGVTAETMVDCEKVLSDRQGAASFNTFQRGFQGR